MKQIIILIIAVFCGNSIKAQTSNNNTFKYPPIGNLIDIGGYRLHINCTGKGKITVVLISGSLGFSFDWTLVQEKLSKETKICSYDRPGLAWSDIGPMPHTLAQDVYELHKLLKAANIRPPYILAGQSIGGLIARKYAKEYPDEVNGIVLVDATSENGAFGVNGKIERLRLLASGEKKIPPIKEKVDAFTKITSEEKMADFLKVIHTPKNGPSFDKFPENIKKIRIWAQTLPEYSTAGGGDFWSEEFAEIYSDSLSFRIGDKPLIVLCSARNDYPKDWNMRDSMMADKIRNQKRFLNFSSDSKLIITENSGHEIHLTEPDLVVDAVLQVLNAIKIKSRLK